MLDGGKKELYRISIEIKNFVYNYVKVHQKQSKIITNEKKFNASIYVACDASKTKHRSTLN